MATIAIVLLLEHPSGPENTSSVGFNNKLRLHARFLATVVGQKVSGLYVPDHGARVKLIDSTRSYSAFAPQSVLVQWRNNRVGKVQGPRVQGTPSSRRKFLKIISPLQ